MAPMTMALRPEERCATVPPAAAAAAALHGALLESRQRWQDLAGLAADFVFETDSAGRFSFLWPETVIGHPATSLLGRRAASLLLGTGPDPFALHQPVRRQRAWVAGAGGKPRCLAFSVVPIGDARGQFAGLRGAALDVTEQEEAAAAAAAGLRRAALLDALAETVRRAGTPREALARGLSSLRDALGCAGTAMIVPEAEGAALVEANGAVPAGLPERAAAALDAGEDWAGRLDGREPAALLHHHGRRPRVSALAAWRGAGSRDWDAEDLAVLRSMAAMLGAVLGFARLQEELEHQAATDALTGLANRRAFLAALASAGSGALLTFDLDNLKPINDRHGHEAGDAALRALAALLRADAGAGEVAARLGGDEFALWMPEADVAAAKARAEALRARAAALAGTPHAPRFSMGIACRPPGSRESARALLARADAALYAAKRGARGSWRLAEPAA
jgi:diguanylate cyclase (GGDEF)-like protein